MTISDLRESRGPIGPVKDKLTIPIGTQDFEIPKGFICQVATAGNLTYRTLDGRSDQTETGLSVGDIINVADIPVVLRVIRGSSTVTSVVIGLL